MLLPLQMIECQAALGELPQAVFFENRKKCSITPPYCIYFSFYILLQPTDALCFITLFVL